MGEEEILDLAAVGKSVPGTMIGNVAMLFGYRMGGYLGGLACVLGMILPPFAVLAVVTVFYGAIRGNPWVAAAMTGFTPLSAFSMLVFILLYVPCAAALAAARRELRSRKYFWMTIGIQLGTAYAVSLLVYQIGRLFVH